MPLCHQSPAPGRAGHDLGEGVRLGEVRGGGVQRLDDHPLAHSGPHHAVPRRVRPEEQQRVPRRRDGVVHAVRPPPLGRGVAGVAHRVDELVLRLLVQLHVLVPRHVGARPVQPHLHRVVPARQEVAAHERSEPPHHGLAREGLVRVVVEGHHGAEAPGGDGVVALELLAQLAAPRRHRQRLVGAQEVGHVPHARRLVGVRRVAG
mmetsp:Transcript_4445/g.10865  ORF Transcript_4445/g.10865 Transcript_4445/m.10865 type:complete len:205 (+) Transcript_4445:300-914(+)